MKSTEELVVTVDGHINEASAHLPIEAFSAEAFAVRLMRCGVTEFEVENDAYHPLKYLFVAEYSSPQWFCVRQNMPQGYSLEVAV